MGDVLKRCSSCGETKPMAEFHGHSKQKDGRHIYCKECNNKKASDWYFKNKKHASNRAKNHYELNKEERKASARDYYSRIKDEKREELRLRGRQWTKNNPSKKAAMKATYRAKKLSCTPQWLDAIHLAQIKWFYAASKMMTDTSGVLHSVDHIHPLNGKGFSGLHVPWNLRIIPAKENSAKCNNLPEKDAYLAWEGTN